MRLLKCAARAAGSWTRVLRVQRGGRVVRLAVDVDRHDQAGVDQLDEVVHEPLGTVVGRRRGFVLREDVEEAERRARAAGTGTARGTGGVRGSALHEGSWMATQIFVGAAFCVGRRTEPRAPRVHARGAIDMNMRRGGKFAALSGDFVKLRTGFSTATWRENTTQVCI
jgi:hypothetical protein